MRARILGLLVAATLASTASAEPAKAPAGDPLLEEMTRWTRVAVEELRLEGAPAPHRVVTALAEIHGYSARASFGELLYETHTRQRPGRVEVVVGEDRLDSSRFSDPRQSRWARRDQRPVQQLSSAVEDARLALSRDLWTSLDASYKKAVQRWKAKVAARRALGGDEPPPDWSEAPPAVAVDLEPLGPVDSAALRELAIDASAVLREIGALDEGEVTANGAVFRYYTVTSEGTRIAQPEGYTALHVKASVIRPDGVEIEDELQWVVRRVSDLPSPDEILEDVRALGRNVRGRVAAGTVDYYEGPVVFEDRAAAQFFRLLVPPEIGGTPPPPEAGRSYQRQTRKGPRLGRRLLPDGWSVVDDPSRVPEKLAAGGAYDREGVRAGKVVLVDDGYVRDFLMSRVPRADKAGSNGHARGSITGDWVARPNAWRVEADRNLSDRAFDTAVKRALESARLDRVLVVRRLRRSRAGSLPSPGLAVWRYPDGREDPVDLLEFENVDRRVLRNVLAAGGGEYVLPYLAAWDPDDYPDRDRGLPTVLTAPRRLLVEDMELVFPGPSKKPHAYPRPR